MEPKFKLYLSVAIQTMTTRLFAWQYNYMATILFVWQYNYMATNLFVWQYNYMATDYLCGNIII